ncbi:helix-turn-helix domain-containing protein, partial [Enterococcus hirae]|uniref:helix-turn-helix domain-containing protein n=1 Tax=Enterococcus hirae TaxID=1354 RepID=UPI00136F1423
MNCSKGCPLAAKIVGIPGVRVLDAHHDGDATSGVLRVVVETDDALAGCRSCGVIATAHGRRMRVLHDVPFGHRQVRLAWRQRLWRCDEAACPVRTWSEEHDLAPPRGLLTRRAVVWAADALAEDDTTVSALARRVGVDWHTLWRPVRREAQRRAADPARLDGVVALGVDEHVWRPGRFGAGRDVTCMVDLTRDAAGQVRARLLDLVPGRSGTAYRTWLDARTAAFRAGVKHAA